MTIQFFHCKLEEAINALLDKSDEETLENNNPFKLAGISALLRILGFAEGLIHRARLTCSAKYRRNYATVSFCNTALRLSRLKELDAPLFLLTNERGLLQKKLIKMLCLNNFHLMTPKRQKPYFDLILKSIAKSSQDRGFKSADTVYTDTFDEIMCSTFINEDINATYGI